MKKNTWLILAGAVGVSLTGCSGGQNSASVSPMSMHQLASSLTSATSGDPFAAPGVAPVAGTGSGGAFGPVSVASLRSLPNGSPQTAPRFPGAKSSSTISKSGANVPAAHQLTSSDATAIAPEGSGKPAATAFSSTSSIGVVKSWKGAGYYGASGASNGSDILTPADGLISIYSLSGSLIKQTGGTSFYCGTNALPVCSISGGYDWMDRVVYQPNIERWVMVAEWVGAQTPTDVMAVSNSTDPTGAWTLYQFPSCGASNTTGQLDAPLIGFNDFWLVVSSYQCFGQGNPGLAAFDEGALSAGSPLTLNGNWFEFVDPNTTITGDDPVATWGQPPGSREYLASGSYNSTPRAVVTYSYIDGTIDAPVFHPNATQVTTSFSAGFPDTVDAPGVPDDVWVTAQEEAGYIQSASLWGLGTSGGTQPYVLSTMVMGDPRFTSGGNIDSNQVVNVALNLTTGKATALQVVSGEGDFGAISSSLNMPYFSSGPNRALIEFNDSNSVFHPGVKASRWNIDTNSLDYTDEVSEGSLTPGSPDAQNWADYSSVMVIPFSSQLGLGGTVASPSSNDSQRATFWAVVNP